MSTIPGGDEPREEQPTGQEPAPAAPQPPVPPEPPLAPQPPAEPVVPEAPAPDDVPPAAYPPPGYQQPPASSYPPPGYQQPGYQQPQASSYPPPGYGYQQAPPPGYQPPPGYAPGAPQPSLFSVALSDGWNAFQRAGWVFAGAMVVWAIGGLIVLGIVSAIFGGWGKLTDANGYRGLTGASFSFSTFVVGLVGAILFALIQAQFVRVALTVTRGHRPTFAEFFRFEDAGPVVVLALIIGVVVGLLRAIPILGGLATLVVEFFLYFAYYLLLDRKVQPVDAIRGSFDLVQRNLGQTLIFYVLAILIGLAGFIACGIGIFVAAPIVLLATAYLYRRLSGEQPQLPA